MNLSDTFYVALCMTVLILGVVYWFWTQNQYIQRKLNLLENIVFEMKTQLGNIASVAGPPCVPAGPVNSGLVIPSEVPSGLTPAVYAPAPASVNGDDDDLLHAELHGEASNVEAEDLAQFENCKPSGKHKRCSRRRWGCRSKRQSTARRSWQRCCRTGEPR